MKEVYRSNWFNLEGYLACTVKYSDDSKATVLMHREVMEKSLGRKLDSSELVHHKDGNKQNNSIYNLEIKSKAEHINHHRKQIEWTTIVCVECGNTKKVMAKDERRRQKDKMNGPFCGKSCVGKWCRRLQLSRKT